MQKSKLLPGESDKEFIFQCVDGKYIDITNQLSSITFADFLVLHNLVIDDDATFCRIIRTYGKFTFTYEIRCHGGKVRVNISVRKII